MRLDHLLSKEHSPEHVPAHRCSDDGLAEPVSFPHVERRELTGGTLTTNSFIVSPAMPASRTSYIDALLGPERTRESMFLSRQDIYRIQMVVIPRFFREVAGAAVSLGCVCCLRIAQWTRASLL